VRENILNYAMQNNHFNISALRGESVDDMLENNSNIEQFSNESPHNPSFNSTTLANPSFSFNQHLALANRARVIAQIQNEIDNQLNELVQNQDFWAGHERQLRPFSPPLLMGRLNNYDSRDEELNVILY
jgi:hypothetical protein